VKSVKNFRYVQKTSAECNEDSYLAILHLSRVELQVARKIAPCNMAFIMSEMYFLIYGFIHSGEDICL
jgi:hypothetical protein